MYSTEWFLESGFLINGEEYYHDELGIMILELSMLYMLDDLSTSREEIKEVDIKNELIFKGILSSFWDVIDTLEFELEDYKKINYAVLKFKDYIKVLNSVDGLSDGVVFNIINHIDSNILLMHTSRHFKIAKSETRISYKKVTVDKNNIERVKIDNFMFYPESLGDYTDIVLQQIVEKIDGELRHED